MAVQAFGFEKHLVIPGENGTVAHAQLTFGSGMIMLGSAREDEFGQWVKPPRETGGIGTQSAYVIVEDADAHYARAKAAGAEIVMEVEDQDYGGRLFAFELCGPHSEHREPPAARLPRSLSSRSAQRIPHENYVCTAERDYTGYCSPEVDKLVDQ
jgi:uncharacterized glyoxalase superfamily protein PhnB